MNLLRLLNHDVVRVSSLPCHPFINSSLKRFRKPSPCDVCTIPLEKKPCFDIKKVSFERGTQCHAKLIRSFLYTQYWPREPSVVGLWMSLESPYLDVLTDQYSHSGDRFLAFERDERTNERKLIGVLVANTTWPWTVDELEQWAHSTTPPDQHRMYFTAHCLRSPNLFEKYKAPYIYDVQVLGTAAEVTGQGVGTQLLSAALQHAEDLRHPLAQVVSLNYYSSKICSRCGMDRDWSMEYGEFVDRAGQRVFYPRRPHTTVTVYTKRFDPKKGGSLPCKPQM